MDKELITIRNRLLQMASEVDGDTPRHGFESSRMLDSIIESAVRLRAKVEGLDDRQRERYLKATRKALGYTYP